MAEDASNIKLIVDLINKKKQISSDINFEILKTHEDENGYCYKVSLNSRNYSIHIPPTILKVKDKKESFYRMKELSLYLNNLKDTNIDYYLKMDANDTIYSIKNSLDSIVKNFKFGLTHELIEKKVDKIFSFDDFSNTIISNNNFPECCKYYNIYCKNEDNIKYITSSNREIFNNIIVNFNYTKENNIFLTGQRGIGKTTTILFNFYFNNNPFFYINLKYFNNSKNELEKAQILNFEKNNLFRPEYIKFELEISKKIIDYKKETHNYFETINNFINDKTEINKIRFMSLILKILIIIYKKLTEEKQLENNIIVEIKNDISNIIKKIQILEIPESIINNDLYNLCLLLKGEAILNLIKKILNYKAYLSYVLYYKDMATYNSTDIWELIQIILKECDKLELEFVLILDQFKNKYNESKRLNQIIENNQNAKIIICSSIDDYKIRKAIIEGIPQYIVVQNELINLENIKDMYKDIFTKMSKEKAKYINLFKNNIREIFDCLKLEDKNLKGYLVQKIKKIQDYFKDFCESNLARITFLIFIFKNISCYWKFQDYKKIMNFIPFKYFTFEKHKKTEKIFTTNYYTIGKLDDDDDDNKKLQEQDKKDEDNYLYKINYSMPIVGISLFKFIKDRGNIIYYEQYMLTGNKGAGKGITFEEYIKSKIINSKFFPVKNLKINETIEIWSLFSVPSTSEIPCFFEGKLEKNKIYFIDIMNQTEPMFDCAIIDLIKNEILFIQITTSKDLTHDVFKKEKIKEKSDEAIQFLKGYILEENINLNIGFFFIFLKYDIDENNEEFLDESSKKLIMDMKKVNIQLEKMKKKCDKEYLSYCIYHLSSNFSNKENQRNIVNNEIDPDDNNLYILKSENVIKTENNNDSKENNNDIKENNNDSKENNNDIKEDNSEIKEDNSEIKEDNSEIKENKSKFFFNKKKRNYIEYENPSTSITLTRINLKFNKFIKKFYEFYKNKFNLKRLNIYIEENKLYSFDKLKYFCKSFNCFAINKNNKEQEDFDSIIYYDTNSSELCIENIKNNIKNYLMTKIKINIMNFIF